MKQHSYAFYSGWLSNEYLRLKRLQHELASLVDDDDDDDDDIRRGVEEEEMEEERVRLIQEIENANRDLTGLVDHQMVYPDNLTYANFLDYMLCPTLVYELEYPRTDRYPPTKTLNGCSLRVLIRRIRWDYIMEKAAATLGSIGLMIVITEHYVLPAIQPILPSQTNGMSFPQKVGELGWVLLDMLFPYSPPPPQHPTPNSAQSRTHPSNSPVFFDVNWYLGSSHYTY